LSLYQNNIKEIDWLCRGNYGNLSKYELDKHFNVRRMRANMNL